jgi:hypothetical protein
MLWATFGVIRPSEGDVVRIRILGLTLLPACAGLLLGLAMQMKRS